MTTKIKDPNDKIKINTEYGVITSANVFDKLSDKSVASTLIQSPLGLQLLANTKNDNGWTALHKAMRYESLSLEMIKNPENLKLLAETKDNNGWSVLHEISWHSNTITELLNSEEGKRLLKETKTNKGSSVINEEKLTLLSNMRDLENESANK
jgi:ankyrin repeat protein